MRYFEKQALRYETIISALDKTLALRKNYKSLLQNNFVRDPLSVKNIKGKIIDTVKKEKYFRKGLTSL